MKILLTGSAGQIGKSITYYIPRGCAALLTDKSTLDITDAKKVESVIIKFCPDLIINAAAYTDVDEAESESSIAESVNVCGVGYLANAAKNVGAKFVHFSTDYAFDGLSTHPYLENDETSPLNVYGKTKREGELLALQENEQSLIIRTSWVYSEYGSNFVAKIFDLLKSGRELFVVGDQLGCPTYAIDLAKIIFALLEKKPEAKGIFNYCGDTQMSWYEFAVKIAKGLKMSNKINNVTSNYFSSKAQRPKYSVLDCSKINQEKIECSNFEYGLKNTLMAFLSNRY